MMDNSGFENKTTIVPPAPPMDMPSFGARKFIITDLHVNKMINLIDKLEGATQTDAIELLRKMQEAPYEEG